MLVVPHPQPVPTRRPAFHPARGAMTSKPDNTPSLLWVNKDASNLHSKKHVAEVNAHVQKRGSRGSTAKRSLRKSSTSSSRDSKTRRRQSESPSVGSYTSSPRPAFPPIQQELLFDATPPPRDKVHGPLQHSRSPEDPALYDSNSLGIISQLAHAEDHFSHHIPTYYELPVPAPAHFSHLSNHDQMLIQTYLSYIPQTLYGPVDDNVYCPIRYASISNMSHDPLGLLWTLIALDMFLAKVRGDLEHTALILHRKDEAYQMMASRMNNPRDSQSLGFIIATGSAAVAELFFGDSSSALMHLGAIDAVVQAQGGNSAIARLPLQVSIPLLTAFAYRTLLQDQLLAASAFEVARTQFVATLRSLLLHDQSIWRATSADSSALYVLPDEMSFRDLLNTNDHVLHLRQAKQRAFALGSVLREFVEPDVIYGKASDSVDHFLVLFTLNVALHDFGSRGDYSHAARFLDDLIQDITVARTRGEAGSTLKMSGVRCLLVSRHAKAFGVDASEGVARAWQAIDGLEVLKTLSPASRNTVYQTLSGMLTMDAPPLMTIEMLESIDMESSTNWWTTTGMQELVAT